ncbi:hypothetical protein B7494_g5201 [Chlorociboria aeruginascens]|nr:hypothetical protein B7494_g5201 [Chlorociboria aeruginascens]
MLACLYARLAMATYLPVRGTVRCLSAVGISVLEVIVIAVNPDESKPICINASVATVSRSEVSFCTATGREINGRPGLSYGVLSYDQVVHTEHFGGYRNVETKTKIDDDTLDFVRSPTKARTLTRTLADVDRLVEDGKITWDALICDVVPDFHQVNNTMKPTSSLAQGPSLPTCNDLEPVVLLRGSWKYSNWGYEIAGEIIQRMSGETYSPSSVKKRIFTPLDMHRTTADEHPSHNLAKAYIVNDDG